VQTQFGGDADDLERDEIHPADDCLGPVAPTQQPAARDLRLVW
jgi:hypothetical protein